MSSQRAKKEEDLRPTYRQTRSIFLRGLSLCYMAAFTSIAAQVDGLIGSHGILPVADYLDRARQVLGPGPAKYCELPTLLWLSSSDLVLHAICWGGVLLAALLFVGLLPGLCAVLLWLLYLSIVVAGQIFLGYQWDMLLLEAGFLAFLMAPWRVRLGRAFDRPWPLSIWLVRWLLFRLDVRVGHGQTHEPRSYMGKPERP